MGEGMSGVFVKVLNMSIAASWLILTVMLLRPVLKKAPKWISVLLWGIAALRLAVPFSFESAWSLVPSAETFSTHNIRFETPAIRSGISAVNNAVNPVLGEMFAPNPGASVNPLDVWMFAASMVWLAGIAAMLLYAVLSYARVRRRVAESVPYAENVFLCDHVRSPFILGLIAPRIYLPSDLDAAAIQPVLAHEQAHLARRDHWWKPLGFLILAVHWLNPLCWLAYVLLCRDIELACDERVIRQLDLDGKKQYSAALLACSTGRRLVTVCPLAFGETGVKERVQSVLHYKKPAFWIVLAAVIACVAAAVCFLTDPVTAQPGTTAEPGTPYAQRPALWMDGALYVDPYMPVSSLPYGYRSAGKLTEEQANNTGLAGIEYFMHPSQTDDFYTWQECGTPIALDMVDSEQRQWAYVRWIRVGDDAAGGRRLTLDDVVLLSQKGDALTWEDFERYEGRETGSGLYIMRYGIDELFEVLVGGIPEKAPVYIYLKVNNEAEDRIEIRTGDVAAFIAAHKDDVPKAAVPDTDPAIEALRAKYPEYFELGTFKGLEVYVWQLAAEDYRFGLMQGTNRMKTLEELMALKSASAQDMALILSTFEIEDKDIFVIPWANPISSYMVTEDRMQDPEYINSIRAMLGLDGVSTGSAGGTDTLAPAEPDAANIGSDAAAAAPDADPVIGLLIETICSGPALSPAPEDFIEEHTDAYQELTDHGRNTLEYCFARFEKGGETGLEGHIMMRACGDIAAGWGETPLEFFLPMDGVLTGQMWYDAFKNNALQLMEQYSETELAERWPASYLLLGMLGKV